MTGFRNSAATSRKMKIVSASSSRKCRSGVIRLYSLDWALLSRGDDAAALKLSDHALGKLARAAALAVEHQFGSRGRLVNLVDAGKIPDFSGKRTPIEALGIARDANLERSVDKHFEELA